LLSVQPTASPTFTGAAIVSGTFQVKANSGSLSHAFGYNENGGEISLYTTSEVQASLIDHVGGTGTRVLELVNGNSLYLGLGASNTTGNVYIQRAGYVTAITVSSTGTATFAGQIVGQAGAAIASTAVNSGLSVGGSSKQVRLSFAPSEGTAPTSAVTGTAYIVSADFGSGYTAMRFEATEFVFAHGIFASEVSTTFKNNGDIVMSRGKLLVTAGSGSSGSYKPGLAISGDDDTGVQQVGGANTLSLVTGGTERVRVDASGAVGIGMTPTSLPLSAFSFATSDANKATLLLSGTVGSGQSFAGIRFSHNVFTTGWGADILCVDTGNFGGILSFRTSATGSATATPTERMRIDASGNVGIGATPSTWGGNIDQVVELKNGVAFASNSAISAGYFVTNIRSADGGGSWIYKTTQFGHLYLQYNGDHIFYIAPSGTAGNTATITERFKISQDNGKITAAGVYNNTVGGTNRDVFVDSGGLIGYVSSIRESKTDIVTLDDVSWLSALSPVSYRYRKKNADGTYSDEADGITDYGLIAEEVEEIAPELCFYDIIDDEPQLRGVTYSKLITPMLKYIQILEKRITDLENQLK
jgi:hypothetical protein